MDKTLSNLTTNLHTLQQRIHQAAIHADRQPDDVLLLAISKRQPAEKIRHAYTLGQREFGENYLQEAQEKFPLLNDLNIIWHFVGPIQSNKTKVIAECFDWVHSVDRIKVAKRLSEQRPADRVPLNVCVQVNIDREASKSGVMPEQCLELAKAIADLPHLTLRGLMAIPAKPNAGDNQVAQEPAILSQTNPFERMQELFLALKSEPALSQLDTLSMGMSADLEDAVSAGATIVRIGTDFFGARPV